jgi:flagellar hook-basal body complex protein FliE
MNQINPIGPIGQPQATGKTVKVQPNARDVPSFKETLNGFLKDVNEMQNKAGESIERMAAGEVTDVHQVMMAAEEANVAFNLMMEIRNKVMDAYQEVMRIRL